MGILFFVFTAVFLYKLFSYQGNYEKPIQRSMVLKLGSEKVKLKFD